MVISSTLFDISFMLSYVIAIRKVREMFYNHIQHSRMFYFSTGFSPDPEEPSKTVEKDGHDQIKSSSQSPKLSQAQGKSKVRQKKVTGKALSPEAQRAYWAWQIIEKIKNAQPPKSISTSIRDQILKMEQITNEYKFSDVHKNEVMKMFSRGIQLNLEVFSQIRVQSALVDEKTIFFPTYSVTKPIFIKLTKGSHNILTGSFGIGKTFSLICFISLSKYINTLKYLAMAPWIPYKKRVTFEKQYKELIKKGLIKPIKKCWYWSVNRKLNETQQNIKQLILKQIDQFNLPSSLQKKLQTSTKLKQIYQILNKNYNIPGIKLTSPLTYECITIIDQINVVASFFNQFNSAKPQVIKKKYKVDQKVNETQFIENKIQQGLQLKKVIQGYLSFGRNWFFNSSYHLEEYLFQKIHLSQAKIPRLNLDLIDHGNSENQNISMAQILQKQSSKQHGKIEFILFLLFQIRVRYRFNKIVKNNIDQIKSSIKPEVFIVKNFYRILYARQFINSPQGQNLIKSLQISLNVKQLQNFVTELSVKLNQWSLKSTQKKLQKFMEKQTDILSFQQKTQLLRLIYTEAMISKKNKRQHIQISISKLQKILMAIIGRNYFNFNEVIEKGSNLQIFPFTYMQGRASIKFDWLPQQYIEITNNILFPSQSLKQIPLLYKWIYNINNSSLGTHGEKILLWLIMFSTSMKMQLYQQGTYLQFSLDNEADFQAFNRCFSINQKKWWLSLISLKRNLEELITKAQEQPNKFIYGFPKNKDQTTNEQKHAQNSIAIDFIIMKYIPQEKKYEINTFDMGIQKADHPKQAEQLLKELLRKVNRYKHIATLQKDKNYKKSAKIKFIQSKADDESNYQIKHTIITPKVYCRPTFIIEPNIFQINYCPLQTLSFEKCSDPKSQSIFEDVRKIIIAKANCRIEDLL